jgi:hypothetical protein
MIASIPKITIKKIFRETLYVLFKKLTAKKVTAVPTRARMTVRRGAPGNAVAVFNSNI